MDPNNPDHAGMGDAADFGGAHINMNDIFKMFSGADGISNGGFDFGGFEGGNGFGFGGFPGFSFSNFSSEENRKSGGKSGSTSYTFKFN